MPEPRLTYLVRMIRGQPRAMVMPLRGWHRPRVWQFPLGASAIDQSLSEALNLAMRALGRGE
jgi:hypothetical protein